MIGKRTDLALEAREIWQESAGETTALPGVEAYDKDSRGFKVTTVKILDEKGSAELCKPIGTYVTVELDSFIRREDEAFDRGAAAIAEEIRAIAGLSDKDTVLVAGLGNRAITPDAIGPETVKSTLVTRHLIEKEPKAFSGFRSVAAMETGVLGTTGIESAGLIKAAIEAMKPDCVIAVDALASRSMDRVCRTVQIADTGIVPGSGVGNGRQALSSETLGVKVIAVGIPTVVDAATLAADMVASSGGSVDEGRLRRLGGDMIVTPREIDSRVTDCAKMLGYGINLAMHKGLSVDDVTMFLS